MYVHVLFSRRDVPNIHCLFAKPLLPCNVISIILLYRNVSITLVIMIFMVRSWFDAPQALAASSAHIRVHVGRLCVWHVASGRQTGFMTWDKSSKLEKISQRYVSSLSDCLKLIEHLTWAVIWRICAQTTGQNQAKHVPCDLHSTPAQISLGPPGR